MKNLFYRYGSICEPDLLDAFSELGLTVSELTIEMENKNLSLPDTVQIVSDTLLDNPADFIFSINFFPFLSEVSNIFKIPYLCWVVDSPVMELYTTSIKNKCNRVFIFDYQLFEEIHPFNPDCIFYLPLAVNCKQKDAVILAATKEQQRFFSSDISFVGSLYTEKCPYDKLTNPPEYLRGFLNGLMEAQLKIYGAYFIEDILTEKMITDFKKHLPGFYSLPGESFLSDKVTMSQLYIGNKISALERVRTMELLTESYSVDIYTGSDTAQIPHIHNRGLAKTLTEMPLIFHNSKINLNITSKAIRSGLSLRIWDILGSGGFVLTNFQSELEDYFILGEDLDCYDSMDDLIEKIDYYLAHESVRKEIAHQAYLKVRQSHTFIHRLEQMLKKAYYLE